MSEQDRGGQAADILEHAERVLIVDDDSSMRTALMESVRRLGFDVQGAVDGADAVERVSRYKPWLVVTDLKMPRLGGLDLIKEIKSRSPHTLMVLMTAYGTVETAVEAMKYGASDYILKPFSTDLLERVIANLKARDVDASMPSPAPIDQRSILTQDPGMVRLLSTVEGVAASQATVLINGESGTGKELLARFIHSRSPRAHRPFIAVNCAALPDGLLESELFGHERGAFTGAIMKKIGKFEMAHTGTLRTDRSGVKSRRQRHDRAGNHGGGGFLQRRCSPENRLRWPDADLHGVRRGREPRQHLLQPDRSRHDRLRPRRQYLRQPFEPR